MHVLKRVVSDNKFLEITNITFDGDARSACELRFRGSFFLIALVYLRMLEKIRALSVFLSLWIHTLHSSTFHPLIKCFVL